MRDDDNMEDNRRKIRLIFLLMVVSLSGAAFMGLFMGRFMVKPVDVLSILGHRFLGIGETLDETMTFVVLNIRLPRVILNILVGAALAVAGASFQGMFQNFLVSPDILGVSSGAGFGAALGIILTSSVGPATTLLAFGCGILSVVITYSLSKIGKESSVLSLVLAGIIVAAVFNALISLMKFVADIEQQLPAITFWLMGSFANKNYQDVQTIIIPVGLGITLLLALRWRINILSLGDEEAYSLGVNPRLTRLMVIFAATIITAASVTVTGIIGWIGLVMPNICRMLVGADHRYLLPASGIAGAILMVIVDILARSLTPAEIPIGVLTALVGAPFFAAIFRKTGRNCG
jgi:iron complex transport system permease protein